MREMLIEQARRLVAELHPDASAVVLAGSVAAGRARAGSDLDLAVLLPDGRDTHRATLRHEGRIAEVFAHTRAGLDELRAFDAASRRGVVQQLYATGLVLLDRDGHAARIVEDCRAELRAGPPPLTAEQRENLRYALTDLLDDLRDAPDRLEALAVGADTLRSAADLLSDHHRAWTGTGKWFPRRLLAADPDLGRDLLEAHRALSETGDPAALLTAAEAVLALAGGPLSAGYHRSWPPAAPASGAAAPGR
ncbi:nucleotidyltransferase domain-containing protein [Kitasatospora sp. NA04385]|uniref:nucleotidyltransferase domain-containing protein n=1 Tax=Kitasatospora sp. NA04385 TaxID=2742135 RepID=UPI0015912D6A|nr:nucleotidyltransferase domain-containing protein [Kitasatospora sp. NA04385]QKW23171.1 nucleotidyltransferase domain-containing protein [Kitasatospora sp. NA04385]